MDSGEGGDGGGGEERESDLSPQGLSVPLRSRAAIPEQGSPTHTSAMAPAKELLTLSPQGPEEVQGDEQTEEGLKGNQRERCLSGRRRLDGEVHLGVEEASVTGSGGQEEEEAISNQSQNKSKCSLLPQQSQHCSSSSTAQASGTLDSKTDPTPSSSPKPAPSLSASPKHFTCPSSSSALHPDTEVKDIKGDQGWISGLPQSFKSQQSTATFPALAGTGPASSPTAEDGGPTGVLHSSVTNGNGAKAPEPNDSQPETEVDDEREKEDPKEAVTKNLNQDLSPNSLTSHMTIMHSRNSCKTLKCPKCNWHYKSQHTLQVHMKEKHPETGGQCVCGGSAGKCVCGGAARGVCTYCSSGKPHPRLARGETYACGYKPYRCEVCDYATSSKGNLSIHMQSDKHLNNVQSGGNTNGHMHVSNSSTPGGHTVDEQTYKLPLALHTPAAQPAKITSAVHSHSHGGKRWRCDVCDYETSIARNLRIHTTSEKHTHNMLRLQRGYYLSQCRGLAPPLKHLQNTGGELSLSMHLSSQQVPEPPVTLGSALTPSPSPSPSPPPAASLSPSGALSLCVFQCMICSSFSSDSLESVEQHLNTPRSLPQTEWCSLVAGGCHCRLCGYTTPLRANFSLHCQTDRHRTRYQLAAHLQEGGDRGQEGAALIAKGNPVQLRCNLCDYVSSSLEKLRGHSLSAQHKAGIRVYRFLQQYDGEVDGGSWLFHCLLCNHSCSSKIQVLKHSQTPTHQQREGLIQLQPMGGEELAAIFTIRKNTDGVTEELSDDMDTTSELQIGLLDQTKDTSNTGSNLVSTENENGRKDQEKGELKRSFSECTETDDAISNKRPKTHQQNENQQTVQCPLCQLKVPYANIRQHLTHVHSVAQDCVDKLISTVTPPVEETALHSKVEALPASCTDEHKMKNGKTSNAKTMDAIASADAQKNGISTETTESEVAAPKDVTALLTPPLEDNTTHPSNGKVAPQSPSSPPTSPSSDPPPLTDRHGYRFRCSRCSLAFPTQEKLQLHWQYHAMRAATECPLCSRQCRSQEALQRHMQNTHSGQQLDNSQGQNTHLLPHTAHYMEHNKSAVQQDFSLSPQIGQEAGEGEDEEMEEEEALESPKKEQFKEMVGEIEEEGLTDTEKHEEAITEPIFTEATSNSLIKKSSNPTLDRYLDPSRPYKCTICSESFTQKTILLVHFNSVSHLHRARRALQDSSAGSTTTAETPRGPDPRPYRCKLCGVGYSQSSTLDIHLRSVLHQTRARAAQNTSASAPTSSTQAREEPSKGSALTKRPDAARSSASSLLGNSLAAEAQSALVNSECQQAKKRVAELLASRNQLMLLQQQQLAQAQAQAHLQQQTALLQSQVMHHLPMGLDNLLKHHFPVAADNLLSLQQQLLLPFYLAGDIKLNSEFAGKIPDLSQFDFTNSILKEGSKTVEKNELSPQTDKQNQNESSDETVYQQNEKCEANGEESGSEPTFVKTKKEPRISEVDKGEVLLPPVKNESQKQEVNVSPINLLGQQCPPPRVPYAAVNGEPLRALLQSYGYELALQYIQSRHRHQQESPFIQDKQKCPEQLEACFKQEYGDVAEEEDGQSEMDKVDIKKVEAQSLALEMNENKPEDEKKEKTCCGDGKKCKDCGKFFSDALILKSHQEYIHRMLFPTSALEKFSKEYRSQYDQMYPITQSKSTESSTVTTTSTAKSTNEDPESVAEELKAQMKPCASSESPIASEAPKQTSTSPFDVKTSTASSSPPSPKAPALSQQEEATTPSTSGTTQSKTMPLSLPKIPMLPLSLPQLQIPPLPLSKLPMPPIPFPMELPLLPPVVMQSVALQPQPWLDSNANPDLTKLYQSQLNPALLGQQPQSSPALLAQQSPLSPALLAQPPQLNTPLLGQASQPSPVPAGQQPQMSPSILEQQGKRTRTRISEEQLAILRKHFDINSLPSDEEINKMSATSGLPHKVIKHWFRNTLFKERQRDKDSPYNFNNPPTTALEESREEEAQSQSLSVSPSTMSPALTSVTTQPQPVDLPRELHRGRRSSRTRFTEQQLETLQGVFEATPYPREEEYERLSALLSLPNRVIVVWFQNARQRARKNQDRGNEESFGGESKSHFDNSHVQSNGFSMNNDEEESRCVDGHGDSHNENSMDFTYEYYTNPDSPAPESSAHALEPVKKIQDDKANLGNDNKTTKNVDEGVKNIDGMHTSLSEKGEGTQDREQPWPSSQKIAPVSDSRKESTNSPAAERSAVSKPSESEDRSTLSSLTAETKQQSTSQPVPTAQFQCTFCPMSLPSFQLWQEHQTRHLLAAQSQVQLLHSGFTDRTMPYMMLHPNHTLMANQMLSGTMSQLHPNAPHPMISHLNSLQMKNTLPDHSGSLSQNTLASLKQNSKLMAEVNFESQRSGKDVEEEHRRDKRQRTTITPEQLEVLYQRYSIDSNPTRGVLESIARDVGLTRRVVQVWFQNTRARERKGQFRSMGPGSTFSLGLNHLRCPFCRALFKVKSALDAHMRSRHWAEAERAGFNLSISNGSSGQIATSSVMERPGPSISSSHLTHPGYPVNKEPNARPPLSSLSITTDFNNPDEDDDYEEEEDEYPCEESSSMADLASSSPEGSGGPSSDWGETPNLQQNYQHSQQQRQRTQMSHFQILQLRDFYRTHRTPNRQECEALGQELGLPHRVVQVWFQNARAKEKRARSMSSDSVEREAELSAGAGERDRA